MSETPAPSSPAVPGARPATAVEQATDATYGAADQETMSEEQFMPTCMIWAMFLGLGVLVLAMVLWALAHIAGAA